METPAMSLETEPQIGVLDLKDPEEQASAIRGIHEYLIRINRPNYLPQMRTRLEQGASISDLVVGVLAHDSGVYPTEAMVAGPDGRFLGDDGKPARGPDGKPLWYEIGVRVRTRDEWREYLRAYKNPDGKETYERLVQQLSETPEKHPEHDVPGYFGIVFYAGNVSITTIYYPPYGTVANASA